MESENVDKCVALESVAKQDNGKRDSMIGSSITRMCSHVHAHTALWETMPIITLHLTCVFSLLCRIQCYATTMALYKLCAISKAM